MALRIDCDYGLLVFQQNCCGMAKILARLSVDYNLPISLVSKINHGYRAATRRSGSLTTK
jgi:hypothetical protein